MKRNLMGIIYREKNRYCSFPHIVNVDGKLIAVFRRASKFSVEAALNGVHTHHDPDSEICMIESYDNGDSWDIDTFKIIYKSEYGVNDPSITLLSNGDLILRFVALKISHSENFKKTNKFLFSHRSEHELVAEVVNNLALISKNNGKDWEELGELKCDEIGPSCSRDPIVQLDDGSLVAPVYTGAPQRSDISWLIRSFDNGVTWCSPTVIAIDQAGEFSQMQGINFNETSVISNGNGDLIALIRGDEAFVTEDQFMPVGGIGKLYISRSLDGGLCWSKPADTGIFGQPGQIQKLKDNSGYLITFGYRKKPFGVRALVLDLDFKRISDKDFIIEEGFPSWDCGYPFSLEIENNLIITVYYANEESGERFIKYKKWKLD